MNIFTIGFSQKSAEEFFELLINNKIDCLLDVRLNNVSQLAGFTKSKDLRYFLKKISNIDYIHNVKYAPTKEILDDYKKNIISWDIYEKKYIKLIDTRQINKLFEKDCLNKYNNVCLLCSEPTAQYCHRRLLSEYLVKNADYIESVKHL